MYLAGGYVVYRKLLNTLRIAVLVSAALEVVKILYSGTLCAPLRVDRRFCGTCRFHLQGRRISQARSQHEAVCLNYKTLNEFE
jgi:hypothetical protein